MNPAALQQTIYDLLTGDATLLAALSSSWGFDPVFADVPQVDEAEDPAYYPFISFGPDFSTPWDTKTTAGANAVLQLNIWSRAGDYMQVKQIAERVYTLTHRTALTISGQTHVTSDVESIEFSLDPDGETRRGLILLRVIYDDS